MKMQSSSPHTAEPVLGDERGLLYPSQLRGMLQGSQLGLVRLTACPLGLGLFGFFSFPLGLHSVGGRGVFAGRCRETI